MEILFGHFCWKIMSKVLIGPNRLKVSKWKNQWGESLQTENLKMKLDPIPTMQLKAIEKRRFSIRLCLKFRQNYEIDL